MSTENRIPRRDRNATRRVAVQFNLDGAWHDFIVDAPGLRTASILGRKLAPEGARFVNAFYVVAS